MFMTILKYNIHCGTINLSIAGKICLGWMVYPMMFMFSVMEYLFCSDNSTIPALYAQAMKEKAEKNEA